MEAALLFIVKIITILLYVITQKQHRLIKLCMLTKQDKLNILYHYYLLRVLNAQFLAAIFMIVQIIFNQML